MRTRTHLFATLLFSALLLSPSIAQELSHSDVETPSTVKVAQARRTAPAAITTTAAGEGEAVAVERVNNWTVGVAGGVLEGTFIRFATDLGKVLDDTENLRIIPMVTYGAAENVSDLLYLKGVDISITDADVFEEFKKEKKYNNIQNRVNYISELYIAECHVLVRPEIKSIKDLAGKKVGLNVKGAGANITGKIVFERMGVKIDPVYINHAAALEMMKSGELAGLLHIAGKPIDIFSKLKLDGPTAGFHFLPVEYGDKFSDYYLPSELTTTDYPQLLKSDERVNTIGVPVVLAVYNWPRNSDRFRRVERFIQGYFARVDKLRRPPHHPKWKEVSLSAKVPGWTRYWLAEELLTKSQNIAERSPSATENATSAEPSIKSPEDKKLFQEFIEWKKQRKKPQP